eukprot:gene49777-67594_t
MVAGALGSRTRDSVLGPLDRALGFGFGALKGLILSSLAFLLVVLVTDTMRGGPSHRPEWLTIARTYPLLNQTSASIADFVDRRRKGEPVFGTGGNISAPRDVLRLATGNPCDVRLTGPMGSAERRAGLCGSRSIGDIDLDDAG